MNVMFWLLICLMLLLVIGLLVYPILKVRQSSSIAYKDSNLNINNEKIKELDVDLAEGRIDRQFYKQAREELDKELLIDIPLENRENSGEHYIGTAKRQIVLAIMISIFVPALTFLLYLELGMHSASDKDFIASQQPVEVQPSIEEMTVQLEQRLQQQGGSVEDWIMLGRAHKYMGANELADKAFAVALEQDSNNAQLMLERAEVMALSKNRAFDNDARALVLKAYSLEPDNANTLWFAGVVEYQYGNFHQAIDHLKRLLPLASGEEDVMKSIVSIVSKSRSALVEAGEEMPALDQILGVQQLQAQSELRDSPVAGTAATPVTANAVVATSSEKSAANNTAVTRLQVLVDVSEQVRQKFDASDTVFVYAKAKQGPRMPLAAERLTLAALPATIVLDDSMAMVEGVSLSAFDEVVVSARVTKTGSAIAQSGDFIGQVDVNGKQADVKLNIVINTVVP